MASFLLLSVCSVFTRNFCWSLVIGGDEEEAIPARVPAFLRDDDFRALVLDVGTSFLFSWTRFDIPSFVLCLTGAELTTMQSSSELSDAARSARLGFVLVEETG